MPDPISWAHSWPYFAAALLFGYLLGSIPFGLVLTRMAGLGDIRAIGSGSIGATNVLRTGSKKLAAATLLLDGSQSMTYGSGKISKLEYAKYLAASMAYLTVNQGDSVGVGMFDGELQNYIQPKSNLSILSDISGEMEKLEPQPRTNVGAVLHEFANRMSQRGFVMLFSDLFDNTEEFISGLNHLRFGGHNVVLFHVLDRYEIEFPLNGMWKFIGLEGEGELVTQPARVRENYLKEFESFIREIKTSCDKAEVDYVMVNTSDPIEHTISNYLLQRSALAKAR